MCVSWINKKKFFESLVNWFFFGVQSLLESNLSLAQSTYYSVKERMLKTLVDGDSLIGIHHETFANQIFGILWNRHCTSFASDFHRHFFQLHSMLTWYVRPLGWHETILSFHDISQHYHLFTMPKRWATDEKCEHNNTTGPTERERCKFTCHNMLILQCADEKFGVERRKRKCANVRSLTYRPLCCIQAHRRTCCTWGFLEPNILAFHKDLKIELSSIKLSGELTVRLTIQLLSFLEHSCESKISNFHVKTIVKKNILRF